MSTSLSRLDAPKRNRSGRHPARPERLVQHDQVLDRLLGGPDPPAGFIPTCRPVAFSKSRIASSMTSVTGSVAAGWTLPVEVLMKSAPAAMARIAGSPDLVVRLELAGLEDHLEVGVATGLLDLDDLVEDGRVVARSGSAAVDDHVDLVRACFDGLRGSRRA